MIARCLDEMAMAVHLLLSHGYDEPAGMEMYRHDPGEAIGARCAVLCTVRRVGGEG